MKADVFAAFIKRFKKLDDVIKDVSGDAERQQEDLENISTAVIKLDEKITHVSEIASSDAATNKSLIDRLADDVPADKSKVYESKFQQLERRLSTMDAAQTKFVRQEGILSARMHENEILIKAKNNEEYCTGIVLTDDQVAVLKGSKGDSGRGIEKLFINKKNHWIIIYTDGERVDLGEVKGDIIYQGGGGVSKQDVLRWTAFAIETDITAGDGITYASGIISADIDTTNLKFTDNGGDNEINTIQDISTTSTPTFSDVTLGTLSAKHSIVHASGTGLHDGGVLSINGSDNTKFDVTAGEGTIVNNYSDPVLAALTEVSWSAFTSVTITNLATQDRTYVAIDSNANIIQQSTPFSADEYRDCIFIGLIEHINNTSIEYVFPLGVIGYDALAQLGDTILAMGIVNTSGNIFSAASTDLTMVKSSGEIFRQGSNYDGTATGRKNPNFKTSSALSPANFRYRNQDGSGSWNEEVSDRTTIVPNLYDDGTGTLATVQNSKYTIQKIYFIEGNAPIVRALYGQVVYNSMAIAESLLSSESSNVDPDLLANFSFRGWLIVKGSATDLSDTSTAKFINSDKFGLTVSGGGTTATTDLQTAYENSVPPQIILDSTNGALSISDATTPLGTNLFAVHNSANTTDYFAVTASGVDVGGDITVTGMVDGRDVATDGSAQDAHIADSTIHFTEASIDHTAIANIGTNTHAQIDTHIADTTLHFTEASIDHTAIANIGTNTHAQIDTHIADTTLHFTEASIDHGSIAGLADDDHTQYFNQTRMGDGTITNIKTSAHATIDGFSSFGGYVGVNGNRAVQIVKAFTGTGNVSNLMVGTESVSVTMGNVNTNLLGTWIASGTQDVSNLAMSSAFGNTMFIQGHVIDDAGGTSSGTIDVAASLHIQRAPINNSGTTITNGPYAIYVQAGTSRFGGVIQADSNITVAGTVDGRDVATDGTKLDGIEALADVTDEANVVSALDGATLTAVTVAGTDKVLVQDADDADNLKTVTAQAIADLSSSTAASSITVADESADTTCFPAFFTAATGDLQPKTNTGLTFDSATGDLGVTGDVNIGASSQLNMANALGDRLNVYGGVYTIGIALATMYYDVANTAKHEFRVNGVEYAHIDASGLDVTGTLDVSVNAVIGAGRVPNASQTLIIDNNQTSAAGDSNQLFVTGDMYLTGDADTYTGSYFNGGNSYISNRTMASVHNHTVRIAPHVIDDPAGASAGSITNSATLYIDGAPTNNSGTTITNGLYSLQVASGNSLFGGDVDITGTETITGDLQVDNLNVNGNTLSSTAGDINITPTAGSKIVLDGTVNVDAGVVTGATSITSTEVVGGVLKLISNQITPTGTNTSIVLLPTGTGTISTPASFVTTGLIDSNNTTDATSGTTGAINTLGGLGVTKKIHCDDTTDATAANTGSFQTAGGIVAAKNIISTGGDISNGKGVWLAGDSATLGATNAGLSFPGLPTYDAYRVEVYCRYTSIPSGVYFTRIRFNGDTTTSNYSSKYFDSSGAPQSQNINGIHINAGTTLKGVNYQTILVAAAGSGEAHSVGFGTKVTHGSSSNIFIGGHYTGSAVIDEIAFEVFSSSTTNTRYTAADRVQVRVDIYGITLGASTRTDGVTAVKT